MKVLQTSSNDAGGARLPKHIVAKGPEMKYLNSQTTSVTGLTVPAGSAFSDFVLLNGTSNATAVTGRVGNKVTWKSMKFNYTYYPGIPSSGASPNSQVRILILFDKHTNGALALPQDAFGSVVPLFNEPMLPDRIPERFVVIADFLSETSSEADTADRMVPISGTFYKRLNLQSVFRGTSNAITDMSEGSILISVANNAAVGAQTGSIVFGYCLEFTDV